MEKDASLQNIFIPSSGAREKAVAITVTVDELSRFNRVKDTIRSINGRKGIIEANKLLHRKILEGLEIIERALENKLA